MYIKEIKDMINLMNENGLSELEVEKEGLRIKLRKGPGANLSPSPSTPPNSHFRHPSGCSHMSCAPSRLSCTGRSAFGSGPS